MKKYSDYLLAFSPFLIGLCIVFTYERFVETFTNCTYEGSTCERIEGIQAYQVNSQLTYVSGGTKLKENDADIKKNLDDKKRVEGEIASKKGEIDNKIREINNAKKKLPNPKIADANVNKIEFEKGLLDEEVTSKQAEVNELAQKDKDLQTLRLKIHNNISSRYSSRLLYSFLTSVFVLLCIGSLIISGIVINSSFNKSITLKWVWFSITAMAAIGFALYFSFNKDDHMTTILKMFKETIFKTKDITENGIKAFNMLGTGTTICLASAACAVFWSVIVAHNTPSTEISDMKKLEIYSNRMKYLRSLLYVTTAMTVVSVLRLNSLLQWHLIFVSEEQSKTFATVSSNFHTSLLSVEGGFYTLILAALYLPVAYTIRDKAHKLEDLQTVGEIPLSASEKDSLLKQMNLLFSFRDFTPRLIAIFSPLLISGPISVLFDYFSKN